MAGYIGNIPVPQGTQIRHTITATAGQTVFNASGGYAPNYVDVYLNGVKLVDVEDFTATNGLTVTLLSPASLNDVVEIISYGALDFFTSVPTGNGGDQIFYTNGKTVTTNYTIADNTNVMSAGPIDIASGVTVEIGSGSTWTIV
jgi:hypothetical protein